MDGDGGHVDRRAPERYDHRAILFELVERRVRRTCGERTRTFFSRREWDFGAVTERRLVNRGSFACEKRPKSI